MPVEFRDIESTTQSSFQVNPGAANATRSSNPDLSNRTWRVANSTWRTHQSTRPSTSQLLSYVARPNTRTVAPMPHSSFDILKPISTSLKWSYIFRFEEERLDRTLKCWSAEEVRYHLSPTQRWNSEPQKFCVRYYFPIVCACPSSMNLLNGDIDCEGRGQRLIQDAMDVVWQEEWRRQGFSGQDPNLSRQKSHPPYQANARPLAHSSLIRLHKIPVTHSRLGLFKLIPFEFSGHFGWSKAQARYFMQFSYQRH